MRKRTVILEDRRYLIYYSFGKTEKSSERRSDASGSKRKAGKK